MVCVHRTQWKAQDCLDPSFGSFCRIHNSVLGLQDALKVFYECSMPQVETAPLSQHRVGSWPQKWPWSVFWLKLCLDSWACGYVKLVHEDEHKLITQTPLLTSTEWFLWVKVCHKHCCTSTLQACTSSQSLGAVLLNTQIAQEQFGSGGHLSKGDWLQPNKSPVKLENFHWAVPGTPQTIANYLPWVHGDRISLPLSAPNSPSYEELTPKGEARF